MLRGDNRRYSAKPTTTGGLATTLVNSGTFNASYVSGQHSYGVSIFGVTGTVTNMATGVIEATGGYGWGVSMFGGSLLNDGRISGGPGSDYSVGVFIGNAGGYISNASTAYPWPTRNCRPYTVEYQATSRDMTQ